MQILPLLKLDLRLREENSKNDLFFLWHELNSRFLWMIIHIMQKNTLLCSKLVVVAARALDKKTRKVTFDFDFR